MNGTSFAVRASSERPHGEFLFPMSTLTMPTDCDRFAAGLKCSVSHQVVANMRTCHAAILLALLPGLLRAQIISSEKFLLVSPGIVAQLEKCDAFPALGRTMIMGFALDHKGFLWIRTNQGLARFDGYDLKVYQENPADTTGVSRAQLSALAIDGDGFVWGATSNAGLSKLDPPTGRSDWYRGGVDDSTSIGTGATRLWVSSEGSSGLAVDPDWHCTSASLIPSYDTICLQTAAVWVISPLPASVSLVDSSGRDWLEEASAS